MELNNNDRQLIYEVQKLAQRVLVSTDNSGRHTVAAGILMKSGKKYFGINCDSIHGTCAEIVAIANMVMNEDKDIETIVAVSSREVGDDAIISPCGNCRQILYENYSDINVIIRVDKGVAKFNIKELLPLAYTNTYK